MLNIQEFINEVADRLLEKYPNIEKIELRPVWKNNDVLLHGMCIKDQESNLSPVIYLDEDYERYTKEQASFDLICENVAKCYEESRFPQTDFEWFLNFETVKERLTIKLINQENNRNITEKNPHFTFGDLAGIYQVRADAEIGNQSGRITVSKEHLQMWGISGKELHQAAMNNLQKANFQIQSMRQIMIENFLETMPKGEDPIGFIREMELDEMFDTKYPMYVLSNEEKVNGAAGILNEKLLQKLANVLNENLIILPSSIHEVIIIPSGKMPLRECIGMVKAINETEVIREERLSDNAYMYERKTRTLYQGMNGRPMQIRIADYEQNKSSVLGKLRDGQSRVAEQNDNVKEQQKPSRSNELGKD